VNPSGKLPVTFPISESDVIAPCQSKSCDYTEQLFVGYRGMTKKQVAFPFGHGLSYTSFGYSWIYPPHSICDSNYVVCGTFTVTNLGKRKGTEIAQIYLDYPMSANEPRTQLRGFYKLDLMAGATTTVDFGFTKRDLSIWDMGTRDWKLQTGKFATYVGSSSRDFRIRAVFNVTGS